MALAILQFRSYQHGAARFRIDTGTNRFYVLRTGPGSYKEEGFEMLDGISFSSGLKENENARNFLHTDTEISIPAESITKENCFVQLTTFKDKSGSAPAYSKVLKVRAPIDLPLLKPDDYSFSNSINSFAMYTQLFNAQRNIPFADTPPAGRRDQEAWLRAIAEAAAPIVLSLLKGCKGKRRSHHRKVEPSIGMLNTILNTFLHGWSGDALQSQAAISQSLSGRTRHYRFADSRPAYARSLEAEKAAPTGQSAVTPPGNVELPPLTDDTFIKSILEEIQKEALLKLFLDNQKEMAAIDPSKNIDINQLLQLLQQVQAPATTGTVAPAVTSQKVPATKPAEEPAKVATTKSINRRRFSGTLSNQVLLSFETAPKIMLDDSDQIVFRKAGLRLRVKPNVAGETPKTTLPKAIFSFCWKDATNKVVYEKIFKQKEVMPNEVIPFDFSAAELQVVPAGVPISVTAEMRWLNTSDAEMKALGNISFILADEFFPKTGGTILPAERELTDMTIYRSFWNKVWESPARQVSNDGETSRKKLWSLDADLKYRVAVSGKNESNGLMDTRLELRETDDVSVTDRTEGRMKSGIELTVTELNKLNPLWGKPVLTGDKLAALMMSAKLAEMAWHGIYPVKLKGKMRERGMLWVVPVMRQQEFVISQIKTVDESGQVTAVTDETVQLPVPVSIRVIGLKSN